MLGVTQSIHKVYPISPIGLQNRFESCKYNCKSTTLHRKTVPSLPFDVRDVSKLEECHQQRNSNVEPVGGTVRLLPNLCCSINHVCHTSWFFGSGFKGGVGEQPTSDHFRPGIEVVEGVVTSWRPSTTSSSPIHPLFPCRTSLIRLQDLASRPCKIGSSGCLNGSTT